MRAPASVRNTQQAYAPPRAHVNRTAIVAIAARHESGNCSTQAPHFGKFDSAPRAELDLDNRRFAVVNNQAIATSNGSDLSVGHSVRLL